jgi:chaperonin cofactor prefoldin
VRTLKQKVEASKTKYAALQARIQAEMQAAA